MSKISHIGTVESISGDSITVRFVQTSACASCKVAGHCSAAESKEKTVVVSDADAARRHAVGDQVKVAMTASNGRRAVLLAFIFPFLVLVGSLGLCYWLTGSEGASALTGLASLIPYYAVLYLFRDRLAEHFAFVIEQ